METDFDCIVVGAGPAGLSAALNLRQRGKTVLVVHSGETLLAKAEQVDNYLGMPGLSGKQMMERFTQHARDASGTVRDADGVMRKLVVWPDELGEGSFRFRLEWWAGYLRERIDARREGSRRAIRDGVTDLESIAAAAEAAGSAARRLAAPDGSGPASGGEEGGYAYLDLVDAVESVLAGASERDAYIFRQHFFQDREYKDIARELGCAPSHNNLDDSTPRAR